VQGNPDDVIRSSGQMLDTILGKPDSAPNRAQDRSDVQQLARTSSKDDAALNLTRRTGDLAVYGIHAAPILCSGANSV
jgi:ATP-binding cassette subfamily C (CFTR/MRP) protein 1